MSSFVPPRCENYSVDSHLAFKDPNGQSSGGGNINVMYARNSAIVEIGDLVSAHGILHRPEPTN
jgi:hypothetical protein